MTQGWSVDPLGRPEDKSCLMYDSLCCQFPALLTVDSSFFLEGRSTWCNSSICGLLKLLEQLNPFLLIVVIAVIIIIKTI